MKNFVKKGEVIDYVNTTGTDIQSGDFVIIGSLVGFAQTKIAAGDTGAVLLKGVFIIAKAAVAISQGAKLYWDSTAKVATNVATSNLFIGYAVAVALAGDLTVELQISNGI